MEAAIDTNGSVLALDVGDRRIGVAIARLASRLPQPWGALDRQTDFIAELTKLIDEHQVQALVVGLPRGLEGQATAQTKTVEDFVEAELKPRFKLEIHYQDEALTSQLAEDELNKKGEPYTKGQVDALAATYILTDFMNENVGAIQ